jgi:hypothetical protein
MSERINLRRSVGVCLCVWLALCAAQAVAQAEPDSEATFESDDAEPEAAPEERDAQAQDEPESAAAAAADSGEAQRLLAAIQIGIGAGQRGVALTDARGGLQSLDTDYYPVLDLGLHGAVSLSSLFSLGLQLRYQTSLGLHAKETPTGRLGEDTSLRSHHVQFGVVPSFRFAESEDAATLQLLLGWAVRGLRSVTDVTIPAFTLHGPLLRAELEIPIGNFFAVRLAPELLAIVGVSSELRAQAGIDGGGYGLGGEFVIAVRAQPWLAFELSYRQARISLATHRPTAFTDTEQYVTLRSVFQY